MSETIYKIYNKIKPNLIFAALFIVFTAAAFYFAYQTFIPAFATGTFSDDFVDIDRMEDNADGRWLDVALETVIGAETAFETAEGAGFLRTLNNTTGAFSNIGMKKTYAADLNNNQVWYYFFPGAVTQGNVKDLISNMGVTLCDGAVGAAGSVCGGNTMTWYACTGDCSTKLTSGAWNNIKFYTTKPDAISGAEFDPVNTASIALMFDVSSKMTAKAGFPSQGWDFMRSGTKIIVTGGSASNPVTFQDMKDYVTTENFDSVSIVASTFVNMGTGLQIGDGSTETFFTDTDKFVFMDMYNTDDKISFILQPKSTTTFGAFEDGFSISGNIIKYPLTASTSAQIHKDTRSSPFVFPSSYAPLPELYLYASAIKGAHDIFFGTSTAAAIGRGQIFDTEIDNASTTFIYSAGVASDGFEFKNVDIHHSTSSATSTAKIFITPNKEYENIRIFASPTNALDIATTTGGPDQITLKNITLSNNKGYDIRIENPYIVNTINSSFTNASTTYLNQERGWTLNKQYTFDVTVKSGGQPVSGASVTLTSDVSGQVFTATTDENGEITQKVVTAFQITHATSSGSVVVTDLNNFTLDVTATGLDASSQTVTIGSAQDLTVLLTSACTSSGADKAYPISVSTSSETGFIPTITLWGAKGGDAGCGAYGNLTCDGDPNTGGNQDIGISEDTAITFDQIRDLAKFAYGECAVKSPAAGSFAVIGFMNIGSTTASTTFVKTASESIDFGFQTKLYASSTFISGEVSATGSPFAGSTISFSGDEAINSDEGQLFTLGETAGAPASVLKLFDSIVLHKTTASTSPAVTPNIFGQLNSNRTSFENWFQIKLKNATNTVEDSVFTNMGAGFLPFVDQGSDTTFDTIKSRKITSGGLYATSSASFRIDNLAITDIDDGKHIRVFNYNNATTTLVNSTFDISLTPTPEDPGIEFNGSGNGAIERAFTLDLKIVDSLNAPIEGATVKLTDSEGNKIFGESGVTTDENGEIGQKTITTDVFKYGPERTNFNTFALEVTATGKTDVSQTLDIQAAQNFSVVLSSACDPIGSDKAYPIEVSTSSVPGFTPTITIWGAKQNDAGCGAYGNLPCDEDRGISEATAITFDQIRDFAAFAFGECAVTEPVEGGTYSVLGFMNIGSTTASTTFVKTSSQSIDFAKQLRMYASSTFISGEVSATGSPFAGSTISFSGEDATTFGEGELFMLATSTAQPLVPGVPAAKLKLFDTIILHKTAATTIPDNPRDLYWNGQVEANRTSFENWNTIRLLNATNTITDVVFTNMFRGFFPEADQGASTTFETIKSRRNLEGGLYASSTANFEIKDFAASDIDDGKHIRVFDYNATTTLINSTFDISLTPTPTDPGIEFNGAA
ncbi:MAG: carboxypeptidase-like regulatory domain-containing protein, partial [bacterium]|nr:carboxypeptidase-like regulatory domain-containing protein [bacterium]